MARKKTVVIEKDGVQAVATEITIEGLLLNGWTVVDDGNKDADQAAQADAQEAEKLEQQKQELFGTEARKNKGAGTTQTVAASDDTKE